MGALTIEFLAARLLMAADCTGAEAPPAYHSNFGAPNVFHLDFNGNILRDTDWILDNRGRVIHSIPYDFDGNKTEFSADEIETIHEIWQRVSEDFVPFDIDVTTEDPTCSSENAGRAIRAVITTNIDDASMGGTGNVWHDGNGGMAFIGSWQWPGTPPPAWVFYNMLAENPAGIANAASHEFGHALGLTHDGSSEEEYYPGHGSGVTAWAPIMGSGRRPITQWSRGEYHDANNAQDDLAIITDVANGVSYRADDHSESAEDASILLTKDGTFTGTGIIETTDDRDVFRLRHGGGQLLLNVNPQAIGPNLDVRIELLDANFVLVARSNPEQNLSAVIDRIVPSGEYFLLVDGDGSRNYSDYGSLGHYTISGTTVAALEGDANSDLTVNFTDFLILSANFLKTEALWSDGDFNLDGSVSFVDFLLLSKNFGRDLNEG